MTRRLSNTPPRWMHRRLFGLVLAMGFGIVCTASLGMWTDSSACGDETTQGRDKDERQGELAASHWAYVTPQRPSLPIMLDAGARDDRRDGPREALDQFVFARMRSAGLIPEPEADRETLIRRVSFALTGLPPTLDEMDAFIADSSPDAYERLVDRLLASPPYGERMATWWLDLARYADTHGYHTDSHRDMWPWRDWVVASFNRNQPFDEFTVWQTAGDLLPEATTEQRLATGFHRNHMINFENGAIADEYRTQYVADRVATTAAVWLGQTLDCARCHDHKYDPFTQTDYFRFFAFFNNIDEQGLDGQRGNASPMIDAPSRLQREDLAAIDRRLGELDRAMTLRASRIDTDFAAWQARAQREGIAAAPPADALLYLPFEDSIDKVAVRGPARFQTGKQGRAILFAGQTSLESRRLSAWRTDEPFAFSAWVFPTSNGPMTVAERRRFDATKEAVDETRGDEPTDEAEAKDDGRSGDINSRDTSPDTQESNDVPGWKLSIDGGQLSLAIHDGIDGSIVVAAREPLAKFRWQHVVIAYDGSRKLGAVTMWIDGASVPVDVDGPPDEVDAADTNPNENAEGEMPHRLNVAEHELPFWIGGAPNGPLMRGMLDELRLFDRRLNETEIGVLAGDDPIASLLAIPFRERTAAQTETLRRHYLEQHDPVYSLQLAEHRAATRTRDDLRRRIPTSMVLAERTDRRPTFILDRGDYRQPTTPVEPGVPSAIRRHADRDRNGGETSQDRLTLARWLVDRRNPLTARVIVNQLWQLQFGRGLVPTPDDFGTRGQPPTHPELLDWLAVEFIESGWDVKRLQRMIVTSATFRQSSRTSPAKRSADPENVWLARGPRMRLPAEMIRDTALLQSGRLDRRIGGPGVHPYQPPGLWEEVSYDPNLFTAQAYTQSRGADLCRRSLYTFWKRAAPHPTMLAFDATDRTVCTLRRDRTSTPLQSLARMNDPMFIDAARALASRVMPVDRRSHRHDNKETPANQNADGADAADSIDESDTALETKTTDDAIVQMFRIVLSRRPTRLEITPLRRLLDAELTHFADHAEAARKLVRVGEPRIEAEDGDASSDAPLFDVQVSRLAAWTVLASAMMNLDEAITRP